MGTQMAKLLNHGKRGLEEFEQGQTSSNRKHSGPKSNPKVTVGKNGILEGGRSTTIQIHYTDSLDLLMKQVNVEGVGMKALINFGAQISAISKSMAKTLGLPIQKLDALLDIEGSAGSVMQYLEYTELRLDIPEIAKFDHDVLMMVYPDSKYCHRVPVIIGTLHIDEALDLATYDKLSSLSRGWKRGIVGCRIIAKELSLKGPVPEPMIHKIGGNVKLMKVITMAPRQAIKTMGLTQIPVLSKRVNVATEAIDNLQYGWVELLPS